MKLRKPLVTISILLVCLGTLTSCKPKNKTPDSSPPVEEETSMKLDFLAIPQQIIALNQAQIKEMDKLKSEDLGPILKSGRIIESRTIINIIFNQIVKLEGDILDSVDMDEALARFILNEDKNIKTYERPRDLDSNFQEITLLEGGHIVIPLHLEDEDQYLKAKLPDKLIDQLEKYMK